MNYIVALLFILGSFFPALTHGQVNDLDYYLPPGEVEWIDDTEQNDQRYLLLHKHNQLSYVRGLIINIPDWNMHPYQSPFIRELYQAMPEYGWQSYALQPPNTDLTGVLWQAATNERYPAPMPDEDLISLRQPLQQRLSQALSYLDNKPGFRIVIAEGIVAAFLIQLYAQQALPAPDALVVIGPYLPQWQLNNALPAQLASFSFPVLDLQPADGNAWSLSTAAERVIQAKRQQHMGYRQRILPRSAHVSQPSLLKHHVYGWLVFEDF